MNIVVSCVLLSLEWKYLLCGWFVLSLKVACLIGGALHLLHLWFLSLVGDGTKKKQIYILMWWTECMEQRSVQPLIDLLALVAGSWQLTNIYESLWDVEVAAFYCLHIWFVVLPSSVVWSMDVVVKSRLSLWLGSKLLHPLFLFAHLVFSHYFPLLPWSHIPLFWSSIDLSWFRLPCQHKTRWLLVDTKPFLAFDWLPSVSN